MSSRCAAVLPDDAGVAYGRSHDRYPELSRSYMGGRGEQQWKGTSFGGVDRAPVIDSAPWSSVIDMPQGNGLGAERGRQRSDLLGWRKGREMESAREAAGVGVGETARSHSNPCHAMPCHDAAGACEHGALRQRGGPERRVREAHQGIPAAAQ